MKFYFNFLFDLITYLENYYIKFIFLDGEPQVIATAPTGKSLPTKLIVNGDTYIARFVPESVGRHSVAILINDQHVIGSPFSCNVYDVNKVIVTGLPGRKGDLSRSINEMNLKELQSKSYF